MRRPTQFEIQMRIMAIGIGTVRGSADSISSRRSWRGIAIVAITSEGGVRTGHSGRLHRATDSIANHQGLSIPEVWRPNAQPAIAQSGQDNGKENFTDNRIRCCRRMPPPTGIFKCRQGQLDLTSQNTSGRPRCWPPPPFTENTFWQPVCVLYTTSCQQMATQIPASSFNPIAAEYIKDIYGKVALPGVNSVTATSSQFFSEQNVYNSRQEIVRLDHTFNNKFSLWGKFENDSIPTVEPGGLFTGAAFRGWRSPTPTHPAKSWWRTHCIASHRP